ncbi:hypothetical protein [Enterovibrio coralii]|uniref:Lipoprotein n=1 Tax=Enterovibrio coralii TaxID=294935 RepID=A0A135I813_9GAMM|nr:hypothetical protein [Enterovibrio coralii]KXF81589.1 hypothetical protein ATN88_02625 [Enterovibrio coralii]
MKRNILVNVHRGVGALAFVTIACFFSSTLIAELWGTPAQITAVKTAILYIIPMLMLSMMATGATGNKLYPNKGKGVMAAKQLRMKVAAMNGLLVMLPSAIYLYVKASSGVFDGYFWTVQGIELVGGALNLTMIGLNIRAGLSLKRKKKPAGAQPA